MVIDAGSSLKNYKFFTGLLRLLSGAPNLKQTHPFVFFKVKPFQPPRQGRRGTDRHGSATSSRRRRAYVGDRRDTEGASGQSP
jgi:hypothetical protein